MKKTGGGFTISPFVQNLLDPVGAGDALLAYSTMGLLKSKSIVVAAILGTLAASCECEIDGNEPIRKEFITSKINKLEKQIKTPL